jgi:putative FmdB family regulatory protein
MPIYEFTCGKCSKSFEQLVRTMSGEVKAECPHCGSAKAEKKLSVMAVVGTEGKGQGGHSHPAGGGGGGGGCGRCQMPGGCGMG